MDRRFLAASPDRLWLADITYIPTREGFLYLSFILDACSRKVVGWSMASHLGAELVVDALEMALWRRSPPSGVVHHSDRGSQYTALSFGQRLEEAGMFPSMGRVGSALDNAMAESFISTLKAEMGVYVFATRGKARSRKLAVRDRLPEVGERALKAVTCPRLRAIGARWWPPGSALRALPRSS